MGVADGTWPQQVAALGDEELAARAEAPLETEKERKKREARERQGKLREYGGPASVSTLLSLASGFELLVLLVVGVLGALAHGVGQPLLCVMFGDLIDAVAGPPALIQDAGNGTATESLAMAPDEDAFFDNVSDIASRFFLIGAGVMVVGSMQGFAFPWFTARQLEKIRPLYFDVMLHRDVAWFDTHDPGALASTMEEDLEVYTNGLGSKFGVSLMSISAVVSGYAFALYLSWQIALVMTVSLPVLGLGAGIMGQSVMDIMHEAQGAYVEAAKLVDEVLFAVRTVVAFGGERRELSRFGVAVGKARRGGIRNRVKMGVGMGYIWMIYICSMGLAFWFGMRLVYDGNSLSVGRMMSAFFCVLTAGFTMGQIPPGLMGLMGARSNMAMFFFFMRNEAEIQKRFADGRKACGAINSLQIKNVHFAYPMRPDAKVLHGLTLDIRKGQKVAVVGESGSGKSTVMALLERFYDPSDGAVLVNGEDLRHFSVTSYRKQIGYVGQEPVLFATSVRKNIMQGCEDAGEEDLQRVARHAKLDFVKSLPDQMETFVGSGGSQFSGGQKQRIAIARALLKKPSLLFLDEATSALDSASEKMIQNTIDDIGSQAELGMTIVSIAHRLSTIRNSDVIYVLRQGQVAESGSHAQLMEQAGGTYQALAKAQEMAGEPQAAEARPGQPPGMERCISSNSRTREAALLKSKSRLEEQDAEAEEASRAKEISKTYQVPMARLLGFCRPEWWAFVPGFLAAMVSGAAFPVLGAYVLVDAMVAFLQPDTERMKDEVEAAAIWFAVVGFAKLTATIVQFYCFALLGESVTMRARTSMLTAMFKQEIGFHDNPEHTPGRLVKQLQIHAYRIATLCLTMGDKADAVCGVLAGLTIGFISCWEMALAMLLAIPVFGLAQSIQMAVMLGGQVEDSANLRAATQVLSDALVNARTVQALGNEKDLVAMYGKLVGSLSKGMLRKNLLSGFVFGFSNGVMFWVCSGGFWFMGFLIKEGRTDFTGGQRTFMGILYAAMSAGMAFVLAGDAAKAKVAAHDMFQLLDRESKINGLQPEGLIPGSGSATELQVGRVEFTDVQFHYPFRPDVQVLKRLSFTIEAGRSVGVVGPSGGGKSTVMAMIQRFYDPQGGRVLVGKDRLALDTLNIRWWRRQVGFVGQEPILFNASVLENVKYGLDEGEEVSSERLEECKRMANLGFLDGKGGQGWQTQVGLRGARLSGGQKQRVAICRALVRNPPVMLLDEATSALDSQSEKVVAAALEAARAGRTSFAIAHRLATIQGCDVILVVSEGQVVEQGTHAELVALDGVYRKLQSQDSEKRG